MQELSLENILSPEKWKHNLLVFCMRGGQDELLYGFAATIKFSTIAGA